MSATLRLGSHGPAVSAVHQALLEAGLLPPEAAEEMSAGHFGEVTDGAVRTFQIKRGLVVDGIVGKKTMAALQSPSDEGDDVPTPTYEQASNLMSAALRIAYAEARRGVREHGTNRGPEVDQYLIGRYGNGRGLLCMKRYTGARCPHCHGKPAAQPACSGAPWCARFVVWCVEGGARAFGTLAPTTGGGDLAGALKWRTWAKKTGRLIAEPKPGCVALYQVPGHGHVWLVARVDGDRHVSIEGNASDRVLMRWRPNAGEGLYFVDLD